MSESTVPSRAEVLSLLDAAYNRRASALAQIGGDADGPGPKDATNRKGRRVPSSLRTRKQTQADGIAEKLEEVHTLLLQASQL